MASMIRVATGPELTKITAENTELIARRDQWPFPWVYPPPGSKRRNPFGSVAAPADEAVVR